MNKRILVVAKMRLNSTRLYRKLLCEIDGQSLADRAMAKLIKVWERSEAPNLCHPGVLTCDKELVELAFEDHGVEIFPRSKGSIANPTTDSPWSLCREDVQQRFDFILQFNPCMPFLKTETIMEALEYIQKTPFWLSVFRKNGWIWDQNSNLIGDGHDEPSTDANSPVYYRDACMFYAYTTESLSWERKDRFLRCAKTIMPYTDNYEFEDIDTEADLHRCRAYKNKKKETFTWHTVTL
jgi:CMP-N-acetylneuraminic acid synthetase